MKLRIFFLSLLLTIIASQSFAQKFSKLWDEVGPRALPPPHHEKGVGDEYKADES